MPVTGTDMELIGRDAELAEVVERVEARRLVTLTGPAGIGKTTLALAVADRLGGSFELGAHLVDLTRVDAPPSVGGAIAGQLGFSSFDAMLASPTETPVLLVIDNCEHVTAGAASAVTDLLLACQSPTILATSRSPLDLPDESLVVLGPLGGPPAGSVDLDNDAVRLFLERARDAGATIGEDQLDVVVELCRHLDGVPLALELAAARTRSMPPAEILARLGQGVEVLARPRFRGVARHRSLADTIDWSYRLLPPEVAAHFDRLGLFAGPFTADLAHAVGVDAGLDDVAAADSLQLLVDSSLVVVEPVGDANRFRLLETVRSFALHRLDEQGIMAEARDRLVDHVVDAAVRILAAGGRRWDRSVFVQLLSLYDNLVSALRWCLANDERERRAMLLAAVLWGVVHQGHTDEIAALCDEVLERWPDSDDPFYVDAVATAATARCLMGDPAGAIALAERTLPAAEQYPTAPVTLRRAMGYAARAAGDRAAAMQRFEEVSILARERNLLALALEADVTHAQLLADGGALDEALALARRAREESIVADSAINEVWAHSVIAHLQLRRDIPSGLAEVEAALDASRQLNYPAGISVNLRSLAWGHIRAGDLTAAAVALSELFQGLLARSGVADLRGALYTTAEFLHEVGSAEWAPIAATAASLPAVGLMGGAVDALVRFPTTDAQPLGTRDATAVARRELKAFLTGAPRVDEPAFPAAAGPAEATARFVDRGGYWEVVYAGREVHAKASKGLADIARLLSAPGREIHSLEIMGATVEEHSTGEVLDEAARRAYEQRIRDLQDDVDAAEADHDLARAERAGAELDALVEHLASALGLGGRSRQGAGSAERARSAVTQRVRSTIRRLATEHPELGRHLEASITTGTYCSYRPEHPVAWEL